MSIFPLKPTSSYVKAYFAALAKFQQHGHTTEGNTRSAFADLLKRGSSPYGWHLVEEFNFKSTKKTSIRADGALIDDLTLQHGIWEAKDTADDLKLEIRKKVEKGYPLVNTLFQSPDYAVLYQDSRIAFDKPITAAAELIEVLQLFFDHQIVPGVDWQKVIKEFSLKIPEIAGGIDTLLDGEHTSNAKFREHFASFAELCRSSINPDLSDKSIRTMLVQHLLTERIFRKVFNNQEFLQRNVIAVEIEKVIGSITAKHFSRDRFLQSLDHFYIPLERAAEQQEDYTEKQHFLNAVYEKFFQSFDPKQADTMGIVYTPQPIVDFMVRSVEEILKQEFGKSLSDEGVHILDPFTGTGNFITRIMQEIKRSALPHKYAHELHCNEIMLLPYYIASMNIEHAYMEKVKEYSPFEGICLVDTFELSEARQSSLFTTENTQRVQRQKDAPIRVVLGNPPYNAWQQDAEDGNANRKYPALDQKIKQAFVKTSSATLTTSLLDPYVKAFQWASERIEEHGVVCFVSNNSYIEQRAFDGMRKALHGWFEQIYVIDLGGNVRRNPKLSGTVHNVFGIQVGVSITLLVKGGKRESTGIAYARMPELWRREQKYQKLTEWNSLRDIDLEKLNPDSRGNWLQAASDPAFEDYIPLKMPGASGLFDLSSNGPKSNNDSFTVNFSRSKLSVVATDMVAHYEVERNRLTHVPKSMRGKHVFVTSAKLKWIRRTRNSVLSNTATAFRPNQIQRTAYRPFTSCWRFVSPVFNEDLYQTSRIVPESATLTTAFAVSQPAPGREAFALATNLVVDHHLTGDSQWFPFYIYNPDGTNRRENITNWALNEFRTHYTDTSITKWDIFHATYAILHHPEYRTRYAANLKRELPRIPFPPDFHAFAAAGKRLMELHIDYEQQPEYPLEQVEDPDADISYNVTKMKLSKDKTTLRYNDFLTLRGIPAGVYDYRLGNRSALEWVIDQYQVSTDKRSGIVNDPNREDDPKYILRLIGQVITVSLETNRIIAALPTLGLPATEVSPTEEASSPAL